MAAIYVRSTDGNNADNGSTWALAKATLVGAAAIDAAGDVIYVSQVNAESAAGAVSYNFAGTGALPVRIICGNDGAAPPTAPATTATIATTGGTDTIGFNGKIYAYGISWTAGSGAGSAPINFCQTGGDKQVFERCSFIMGSVGGAGGLAMSNAGTVTATELIHVSCSYKFSNISNGFFPYGRARIINGSIISGSTATTQLVQTGGSGNRIVDMVFEGGDWSNMATTTHLYIGGSAGSGGRIDFRNMSLPSSWSGSLVATAITVPGLIVAAYGCKNMGTNMWIETYGGSIKEETTIVRTGGASDGTTPISWKLASSANVKYPVSALETSGTGKELAAWNDTTGSSKTATVEIVHDSVTALNDDEVWLEIQYLGTAGSTVCTVATDCVAGPLTAAAAQTTSSTTWTTTGLTNPNKQKLEVTFTPQAKGPVLARVFLAKASKTVYVDPVLTIA